MLDFSILNNSFLSDDLNTMFLYWDNDEENNLKRILIDVGRHEYRRTWVENESGFIWEKKYSEKYFEKLEEPEIQLFLEKRLHYLVSYLKSENKSR